MNYGQRILRLHHDRFAKSRTLYTGVTNDLMRRMYEHKNKLVKGFTSKYNIQSRVYYESTSSIHSAIEREKQIKGWLRVIYVYFRARKNPMIKIVSSSFVI